VARTAKRLGATDAIIVYRRTRDRMPAHDFELEEALEEGVMMKWLSTIKRMDEGVITVEKMVLDATGWHLLLEGGGQGPLRRQQISAGRRSGFDPGRTTGRGPRRHLDQHRLEQRQVEHRLGA